MQHEKEKTHTHLHVSEHVYTQHTGEMYVFYIRRSFCCVDDENNKAHKVRRSCGKENEIHRSTE